MGLWTQKLSTSPEWALIYLYQLRSDTIRLIPSLVMGCQRSLHLFERACIEDFLRYVYFYDHKIEHILVQDYPKKYQNFTFLLDWLKGYPSLAGYEETVSTNCGNLTARYSEVSRTIHATTLGDQNLSDNLKALQKPLEHPIRELRLMKSIFKSIFYLLSLFHLDLFNSFSLDERALICQHLKENEKQALSGLE